MGNPVYRKRQLNENFLKALMDGNLKYLISKIKEDPALVLCLRGGLKPEYINIYYRGHSLFNIRQSKNDPNSKYTITFNFNHARYTNNWADHLETLGALGYKLHEKNNKNNVFFPFLKCEDETQTKKIKNPCRNEIKFTTDKPINENFWTNSILTIKKIIDDFYDPNLKIDYFTKENSADFPNPADYTKTKKDPFIEKQDQQRIMFSNYLFKTEYFVFDMEYDEARSSNDENKSGRFDFLAIRKLGESNKYHLVFIELKSTKGACSGPSGLQKHKDDFATYTEDTMNIKIRTEDAKVICHQLWDLFADKTENSQLNINISDSEYELLFVFTGDARNYNSEILKEQEQLSLQDGDFLLRLPQPPPKSQP